MTDEDRPEGMSTAQSERGSLLELFLVALRLGLTSFGGPVAHLGYYHAEYVRRRRWIDEATYGDLVALCNFLPGPASSQIGIAIGTLRGGLLGGVLVWIGFTLPSAVLMIAFAYGVSEFDVLDAGWLHGLKLAAVAVVANAVWGMARSLAPDRERATIAILAAIALLAVTTPLTQVLVIVAGGLFGWRLLGAPDAVGAAGRSMPVLGGRFAVAMLVLFFALLVALPVLRGIFETQWLNLFDSFYRAGSLIFGGGHVVLPLLQSEVVPQGWLTVDEFTAGYGAAQAVPGPLLTFAAYLGAVAGPQPNGWIGGTWTVFAIFLPSFLLVWGTLPFWDRLRAIASFQAALRGIGAAVVGILLAALYDPVFTSAVFDAADLAVAIAAFGLLSFWRLPPWGVVIFAAVGGQFLALV
jgi:chromate transporter